jgi:hypothetical protein
MLIPTSPTEFRVPDPSQLCLHQNLEDVTVSAQVRMISSNGLELMLSIMNLSENSKEESCLSFTEQIKTTMSVLKETSRNCH